ncbi:MAG: ATP-dependent DNA helicase RecG [Lachnospiraceae bacterium]|nr:ATP-dependent DNA helicase RecG [Lachnospiraceae bacterium]
MDFYSPITSLKGVGSKTAALFEALDIANVGALLYHFPRTYQVYPEPITDPGEAVGEKAAIRMELNAPITVKRTRNLDISIGMGYVKGTLPAKRIPLELVWFRMPYIRKQIHPGREYIFYGEVKQLKSTSYSMQQPAVYTLEDYTRLQKKPQAVYALTKGLTNHAVTKAVLQLIDHPTITEEYLPDTLLRKRGLLGYHRALSLIHQPDDFESLAEARNRLVYDEFFKFFLTRDLERDGMAGIRNHWRFPQDAMFRKVLDSLPFALTEGQSKALSDMRGDLEGDHISQRLIQGDVGSGKTILAFLIMLLAVENGYQAAIMAPTEVLARQHEKTFRAYCQQFSLPYEVVCITGSDKAKQRRLLNDCVAAEASLFIIGTHALLSEGMRYHKLCVVITDEQHRFGVRQRRILQEKGQDPHVFVMSATPIPRTLAMILYSDMHLSVVKDVPARRLPIRNTVITKDKRARGLNFIRQEIEKGRQAYIICPLVEASEKTEAENVVEYVAYLNQYYRGSISVGLLHGKMKPAEKDAIMADFSEKKIQILVSTTVVEVGINVPNATVMMIEDANRFGLAQLHQLRGRVGRGEWQSYCIFVDSSPKGQESNRLSVLAGSNDGFFIANEDLRLRGPGDFFGIRQSGDLDFKLADIYQDAEIMKLAAEDAKSLAQSDPALSKHDRVREYLNRMDTVIFSNL